MKLKILQVYKSVELDKKQELYFSTEAIKHNGQLEMELINGLGVKISTSKDTVIVPFANIAFFKPEDVDSSAVKSKKPKSLSAE